jgi:2-polyprenyl-3-methyl-5-hydroxy-6-metoxy-1,4-benzoquinol methylase
LTASGEQDPAAGTPALGQMREAWDQFAERDAMFYIHCDRSDWTPEDFFADGREHFAAVMRRYGDRVEHGSLLDIGCGLGRITQAAAAHFDRAVGADISSKMLEGARSLDPPANVTYVQITSPELSQLDDDSFDLVCSFSVFQHITDEDVIAGYVKATARILKPSGRALLHFDTAPESRLRSLLLTLPDWMLPRKNRRFMRRARRDAGRIRALIADAGLAIEEERHPDSILHEFFLRPA